MQNSSCCSDQSISQGNNKVKDAVCGMEIQPTETTPQFAHKGNIYYFCNDSCKEKFVANPQQYIYSLAN